MHTIPSKIIKLDTQELEVYIDTRYEAGAPQRELEALETAFAERVSEDDELNMTEEEPNMAEAQDMGVDLEEWLAIEYFQYLNPKERTRDYFSPDSFNDFFSLNLKPKTFTNTDEISSIDKNKSKTCKPPIQIISII